MNEFKEEELPTIIPARLFVSYHGRLRNFFYRNYGDSRIFSVAKKAIDIQVGFVDDYVYNAFHFPRQQYRIGEKTLTCIWFIKNFGRLISNGVCWKYFIKVIFSADSRRPALIRSA